MASVLEEAIYKQYRMAHVERPITNLFTQASVYTGLFSIKGAMERSKDINRVYLNAPLIENENECNESRQQVVSSISRSASSISLSEPSSSLSNDDTIVIDGPVSSLPIPPPTATPIHASIAVTIAIPGQGHLIIDLMFTDTVNELIGLIEKVLAIKYYSFSLVFQNQEVTDYTANVIEYGFYDGCAIQLIMKTNSGSDSHHKMEHEITHCTFLDFLESMKSENLEKYLALKNEYIANYADHVIIGCDPETQQLSLSIGEPLMDRSIDSSRIRWKSNNHAQELSLPTVSTKIIIPIISYEVSPHEEEPTTLLIPIVTYEDPTPLQTDELAKETLENLSSSLPVLSPVDNNTRYSCSQCKKKLRLTNRFMCRCGLCLCSMHRYSDRHPCTFDFFAENSKLLTKQNPVTSGSKIAHI
jgi:hypothetical protein